MRIAVIGVSLFACLVFAALVPALVPRVGRAERAAPGGNGGLIALSAPGEHGQQVTLIDPETRVVGVYHIDAATGEIVLKSIRNIHWDLQMNEFNGTSPLPSEVRSMLDRK